MLFVFQNHCAFTSNMCRGFQKPNKMVINHSFNCLGKSMIIIFFEVFSSLGNSDDGGISPGERKFFSFPNTEKDFFEGTGEKLQADAFQFIW